MPIFAVSQISAPSTTCFNQQFQISTSSPELGVTWDFCEGDLSLTPTLYAGSSANLNIPVGTALIRANDKWYGFITSLANNSIIKLDFGESLLNTAPATTNLGNLGGLLNGPQEIKIIEHQSNYYAFVFNKNANKLVRINLGTNLDNPAASATAILTGSGFDNGGLDVLFDGTNWIASVTNANTLTLVNLGTSPANDPLPENVLTTGTIPEASGIADVKFVQDGGLWYGLVVAYSSWTIHRLDFPSTLGGGFTSSTKIATLPAAPYGLVVERDNGKWIIISSTLQGKFYRIDLGYELTTASPATENLGNLGGANNTLKLDAAHADSRWVALVANWNSTNFYILHFPQAECAFDQISSTEPQPILIAEKTGSRYISGFQKDSDRSIHQTKLIETQEKPAPQLAFSTTSLCEDVAGTFRATADQVLTSVSWNFSAVGSSTEEMPSVTFSSTGSYSVELTGLSDNGCSNFHRENINIYAPLTNIAHFDIPSGLICTNNELIFTNTTAENYDGNLVFKWFVDNTPVSEERDLVYTFNTSIAHQVKLRASIPGCFDELAQTITDIGTGPVVDFSFDGNCEENVVHFTKLISEEVNAFSWTLPDGSMTTENNPSFVFDSPGEFPVKLSAVSSNGCNNSSTKYVRIYAKPAPQFSTNPPPQSCAGSPTPFANITPPLTDSYINFWRWNFGDPNSSSNILETQSAAHLYASPGTYTVELKAKTNQGCEGVIQKEITIAQSPNADFTNTSTCMGVASTLSSTGADIKTYYWEIGTSYYVTKTVNHVFNTTGEHNVKLTVTGNNNCNTVVNRKLTVPVPLVPTFSVSKNCVGYEAEFEDHTTGADAIVWRQWNIAGEVTENSEQVSYTPSKAEPLATTLTVKGSSGCTYSKRLDVSVWKAPVSKFTVTPASGAIPLEVEVDNLSEDASRFLWTFNDGTITTSDAIEPTYSFTTIGEHVIELKASNAVGCESVSSKIIDAQTPAPDVEIKLITLSQNPDKTLKVIVTLQNNGNTIVKNLPVRIDLSGQLVLNETVEGPLNPNQQYNLVLGYGISKNQDLDFLCAETTLQNDITLGGNRSCIQFEKTPLILSPYPNPATDILNIEWIAAEPHRVNILITDGFGKALLQKDIDATSGLNQQYFDVHELNAGIYFLVINDGFTVKTQRILISPKN